MDSAPAATPAKRAHDGDGAAPPKKKRGGQANRCARCGKQRNVCLRSDCPGTASKSTRRTARKAQPRDVTNITDGRKSQATGCRNDRREGRPVTLPRAPPPRHPASPLAPRSTTLPVWPRACSRAPAQTTRRRTSASASSCVSLCGDHGKCFVREWPRVASGVKGYRSPAADGLT